MMGRQTNYVTVRAFRFLRQPSARRRRISLTIRFESDKVASGWGPING